MTDDERLERALGIDGDRTFYVEARVGSENHRGKCCRVLWRDARNNEPADELIPLLVAEVRRLRAAVAWHEKELAAEREVALVFEEMEQELLDARGIRREPKSTPAITLAAEVDRLRAAVAAERAWAAGVVLSMPVSPRTDATTTEAVVAMSDLLRQAAAAIRRGPGPTEGV